MKPITLNQAKGLRVGDTLYHITRRNADNTPERWRVNGRVKTWKTMPERVRVPIKHGLYAYGTLNEWDLENFTLHIPSWLE